MNERILNHLPREASSISVTVFSIGLIWFVTVLISAMTGIFTYAEDQPPLPILLAITTPVAVFGLSYLGNPSFRQWALSLDMRRLILLHSWRMVGIGFVFLYFQDRLPALFALPAGIGDAMAAIGAVFLAISLYENESLVSNKRIWRWNTFGLVDFVIAVSMGVMTRTGDVLHIQGQAGSDIMSIFPQVVVPGFFVPFYVITHLIIYAQLRHRT